MTTEVDGTYLYLDGRAGSGDLLQYLTPRRDVILTQLDSGDVMFCGNGPGGKTVLVGIEVKKLGDALQCMQDGRLAATQLLRMHDDYDYVFLLLEDEIRADAHGYLQRKLRKQLANRKWIERWVDAYFGNKQRIMYADFMAWLLTLQVAGQMRLLRTNNHEETGRMIMALRRWFQGKEFDQHKSLRVFDESHQPQLVRPSRAAKVARDLADGIGWEKAMAVAEHFGTIRNMVTADAKSWQEVDGIGKEIAARVVANVSEQHVRQTVRTKRRK